MPGEPLPRGLLPPGAGLPVVAVRVQRDPAPRQEPSPDLDVPRVQELNEILHDRVHDILVVVSVVPVGEEIELERLALDDLFIRDIGDHDVRVIRLPGDRAQAREFRAVRLHEVIIFRMQVVERLKERRIIFRPVFSMPAPKLC